MKSSEISADTLHQQGGSGELVYVTVKEARHELARPDYQFVVGQQQILWFREQLGP